jgi:predicted nucleotide-binding protein (sugar kinase/HSP70/actin superfamily)
MEFFREEMTGPSVDGNGGPKSGKPYLQLEIDEHSADAGLITRCEAFLDTLENVGANGARRAFDPPEFSVRRFTNHRRVYLPNMSPHVHPVAAAIRASGGDAQVMAVSNDESVALGQRTTSGRECYPCLLTTGDIVRQTRQPDFDPSRAAFFMPSTDGPCRFGQYNRLQRRVLDNLGFDQVPILSIDQDDDYRHAVSGMGSGFERRAWRGIVAVDALEKVLLDTRPYETEPGTADAWFWDAVRRVCSATERRDELWPVLEEIAEGSRAIPRTPPDGRPLIGVVGEVYVRTNAFANQDLVRQIEGLGGRVAAPTMAEWLRYTSTMRRVRSQHFHRYRELIIDYLVDRAALRDERRIYGLLGLEPDPGPAELFECARPYLDPGFQGEAILTIGKAVEMIREMGVSGIVNTMPFGCMPGTICTALLKRVREDHGGVPVYDAAFTGQQELNSHVRLEAFLHQARQFTSVSR